MRVTMVSPPPGKHCGIASYTGYLLRSMMEISQPSVRLSLVSYGAGRPGRVEGISEADWVPVRSGYAPALCDAVARTNPDVVHIQHEYGIFGADDNFLDLLSLLAQLGCATVVTLHTVHTSLSVDLGCGWSQGFSLDGVSIEEYQRAISRYADVIVAHQETSMKQTLVRQGIPERKIVTIPHGTLLVNRDTLDTHSLHDGSTAWPLIVLPGYLRNSKNAAMAIDAFASIAQDWPDGMLWIGGYLRGDASPEAQAYLEACRARAAHHELANKVRLCRSPLSETELSILLASADLVLCVYDEDTRSASGILHRALGLDATVVASRRPKFHELAEVCDELLVDPGRPIELADLVRRLLNDVEFRRAVKRPLRALAARTAWPQVSRSHVNTYASARDARVARSHVNPYANARDAQVAVGA